MLQKDAVWLYAKRQGVILLIKQSHKQFDA